MKYSYMPFNAEGLFACIRRVSACFLVLCLINGCTPASLTELSEGKLDRSSALLQERPNIVLIVADDLGYSDLGAFGSEIRTPNLDALARRGIRLNNFHTAPQCSATRAMLLTGVDFHSAGLGAGAGEMLDLRQRGQSGYEGYLNNRVSSVVNELQKGGYRTVMAGKWHLGLTPQSDPHARGFDKSFALLAGADNHFGVPKETENGLTGAEVPYIYTENGKPVRKLPADFDYSSDYFTTKLIDYLGQTNDNTKPFFAYLPFSAPHYPLQAPVEDIARYEGVYDVGWNAIRTARLARQRELELVEPQEPVRDPIKSERSWSELTSEERAIEARKMEVYAAMVDRLDQNVGRLVDWLKAHGEYDNTIFVFFADNGAEGFAMEESSIPSHAAYGRKILSGADNTFESLGSADSYFWYGSQWGQVGSTPGYLYKHYPTEGGTRTPAFITLPGQEGRRGVGETFTSVLDIAPTLLDWAGVVRGDDGKLPYIGASMSPYLSGATHRVHDSQYSMGMEFWGRRSYRRGDWKIVHIPEPEGRGNWMLFDMATDPNETIDLAVEHPELVDQLVSGWTAYARENGVVMPAQPGL